MGDHPPTETPAGDPVPPPAAVASAVATARADHAPTQLPPQLPVVDLIGLRFSLQHLRLAGYGLLAVWLAEMLNLLSSPGLDEVGSRLHYISQFLDLSPILLVGIGLIAFQGGLRRHALEQILLPLLLTLLPLLSALHFFLAPVSVANVITLTQKQQQIGLDQIERIDRQIDRAASILRETDSIETLLSGLQRIPGLQVQLPGDASLLEAREQVRLSLQRERDRVRQRIEANISGSREAFLRRAVINAVLALLVGGLLWVLHHGAMREMAQAIPFLDWVLVHGESGQRPEDLQSLLRFQRACVALGWFTLLERCLRLVRRAVRRVPSDDIEEAREPMGAGLEPPAAFDPLEPPLPFSTPGSWPSAAGQPAAFREAPRRPSPMGGRADLSGLSVTARPEVDRPWLELPAGGADDSAALPPPHPLFAWIRRSDEVRQRREERRRRRDLERYHAIRRQLERAGIDPFERLRVLAGLAEPLAPGIASASENDGLAGDPSAGDPSLASADPLPGRPADSSAMELPRAGGHGAAVLHADASGALSGQPPLTPRQLQRLQRDHERARQALRHMVLSDSLFELHGAGEDLELALLEELELERAARGPSRPDPAPPGALARLWRWFVRHS